MATTGTSAFDMDFAEVAEESWERAGREMRSGHDLRTARRSFNLLTIEWQNRGINMWTIDEGAVPLISGTAEYTLPADTIDLLEHVIRENDGTSRQTDTNMSRISVSTYSSIPNKLQQGRPLQLFVKREAAAPKVVVWPVPQNNNYTLQYWRMRRIEDAGRGVETQDMPFRFLPAIVAGLAYYIAMKVPELEPRVLMLKQIYDEQFRMAAEEDREKATWRLVPQRARI